MPASLQLQLHVCPETGLTDGTPGVVDFQDSETVTTALAGYYFQKTVENLTSGAGPATRTVDTTIHDFDCHYELNLDRPEYRYEIRRRASTAAN